MKLSDNRRWCKRRVAACFLNLGNSFIVIGVHLKNNYVYNIETFEDATSLAIVSREKNNVIFQDKKGKWFYK